MNIDLLHKAVEEACRLGASYADVRLEEGEWTSINVRMGSVERATLSRRRGAGVRVLVEGAWGFSSTEIVTRDALMEAVKSAVKMARSSAPARRRKVKLADTKVVKDRVRAKVKENPSTVEPGEKARLALDLDKLACSYGDVVKDVSIRYLDENSRRTFVSSEGAEVIVEYVRVYLVSYVTAGEAGVLSPAYEAMGGVKGYEIFRGEEPYNMVRTTAERAIRLLKAGMPKGGLSTVVLDNKLLALIVHEAFGHCAEADMVLTGDVLTGKIGQKIASELVTIVDDPLPEYANGWTPYDDEGVKARRVTIVEKGVLREYMQSRETAAELGMEPTGNARAQDYSYAPIVRMRNTYMLPGDWKPEEIIEETREGFYLKGAMGGQADANGDFMFSVQEAWRIEGGELREAYRGVTVSGNALEVLSSVDVVGEDLKIGFPGTCGKWQLVPVDGGGPHIRCKIIVGGAR
ncbi:MAG: TldD/PmbA family protein [Thermoprotei archaeon]|nr:MAG: TldD/PmbA family protein [Thermoprotei archaeon]